MFQLRSLTFFAFVPGLALLSACSGAAVPVGIDPTANDSGSTSRSDASDDPCADIGVPTIACATGPTVPVCEVVGNHAEWQITCPGEDGGSASSDASAPNPCSALAIPALACATGPTVPVCEVAGGQPEWSITCPGAPGQDGGAVDASGPSACKPQNFDPIFCPATPATVTCVISNGTASWVSVCPGDDSGAALDAGVDPSACGPAANPVLCPGHSATVTCDVSSGTPTLVVSCGGNGG